jgi:hypothetical protein
VYSALETNVTNVTSYNNTQYGFQFDKSTGIKLWNTTAYNNSVAGYLIGRESGVTLYETTQTYTNKHDYEVNNTAGSSATTANLTQARLRSPAGPYSNATVVTLSDNAGPGDAYTLNWTTNSTAIPTDLDSFESKWVNISPIGASLPTIDRFLIHWDESETTDYFEDRLEFWKYSTQMGWSMLNNTPNTTTNEMSLASFYPTSDYGIVENKTNRAPTIAATILNATDDPLNRTNANLTSWVTGISDQDNDDVKLFYNWYINETSITVLNLLMSTDADYIADQQTVIDISGHENNATLGSPAAGDSAEPAFDKKGTYQGYGAYDFDGSDDYMNVSDDNTLDFNANSFSVEVWVKSDGAANPGGDEGIIYKRDASTGYNIYFDSSGMVNLYYRNSSTIRTAQYATDVYDDDWHHVVVTRSVEQDNISLYVDGVWRDDDLGVASGMANSADLIIGSQSVGAGQNLDGTISDTLIYNLTLTPEQVRHNFDSGIGRHNITVSTHTKKHDWWNFSVTPVDRRGKKGDKLHSNKVLIMNTPPLNSTLQAPNNGNDTLMTRFPTLNWTNVTDDDEDYVSFKLNITHETCGSIVYTGITDLNKTPDIELHTYDPDEGCTGWYNWTVEGYDGEEYGLPSAKWGFKVMPIIILSLENTVVDFGNMIPGESDNTSDNDPLPFLVENLGTVVSDIINSTADSSLWIREPSPTENFQLKVSDNETGSINLSGSATSWTDIGLSNITIIDSLNYSDANDRVKIDVRIDVPADEPPGQKSVNITFYGAQT